MSDIDFVPLIEPVARLLWGEPPKAFVTKLSLRWGNNGSKSIDLQKGTFFDHEAAEGGGVIDLVMRETGADKAGAMQWLEDNKFIEPRATSTQPRQEARAADLGPGVPPLDESLPASTPEAKQVDVCAYDYVNRDGERIYQVLRRQWKLPDGSWVIDPKSGNPKKTFIQRRRDEHGNIVWNLEGIGHTIYRHNLVEAAIAEGKTILMPEGEKDVHTLETWGLGATTNSGGAANWKPRLAELFAGADVVVLGDDDEAGRKRVETIGLSLRGIARRIRAIGSWGGPKDVTDWRDAGGTSIDLEKIIVGLPDWRPAPPASTMGAVGVHQLHDPSLKHDFLIDGFLDRQGVAMMPGASGSGKTFLVLEMAMCIALGRPFWGMQCKSGVVLYQAGEGKQGVAKRLDAWMQDRAVSPDAAIPFQMLTKRVNLFVDDKDTDALIEEGKKWAAFYGVPVRMVVLDTFNKIITGANENAGQDMGKVLSRMERISTELDCTVLSPMHKSKEGSMRGHTSLMGDVSNVINVTELQISDRNGRIIRTAALDKNKDGERGKPKRFVLRNVVTGEDEFGKVQSTCVIDHPDGDEEENVRQGRLTYPHIITLKAMRQAVEDFGEDAPNGIRTSVKRVVKYQRWQDALRKMWQFQAGEDQPEARAKELQRVLTNNGRALLAGDYIGRDNDLGIVWLTGKDDRPKREAKPIEKPKPSPLMTAEDLDVPF